MDVAKICAFPCILISEYLENYDFGKRLLERKTIEITTFRLRCRIFFDCLIVTLLKTTSATSAINRGIYSFVPEPMLDGDDSTAFALLAGFCKVLETCVVFAPDESKAALEEYTSYKVERRRSNVNCRQDPICFWILVFRHVIEFSICLNVVVSLSG